MEEAINKLVCFKQNVANILTHPIFEYGKQPFATLTFL